MGLLFRLGVRRVMACALTIKESQINSTIIKNNKRKGNRVYTN